MQSGLWQQLALFDVRGYAIVSAILLCFSISVILTWVLRARYARIAADLTEKAGVVPFESPLLRQIAQDVKEVFREGGAGQGLAGQGPNIQAMIEHNVQQKLRGSLIGERFVRSSTGLVIILGLVGTFYGLSLSIGKLVGLLSVDSGTVDITQALTVGLTDTLSGMSVAFTSSLAGVTSAIALTLLGVFWNLASARTALMLQIETYFDRRLAAEAMAQPPGAAPLNVPLASRELEQALASFGESVAQLNGSVARFEAALHGFATTTRDFREFNLHLKDNVQRMSLSFADLSEVLKEQAVVRSERVS